MNDQKAVLGGHSKLNLNSDRVAIPAPIVQDVVEVRGKDENIIC